MSAHRGERRNNGPVSCIPHILFRNAVFCVVVDTMKKKPPLASLTPEERDARLKKIIMSGLGKAWMFWPPRNEVKRRCAIVFNNESGWFRCELCKREVQKIDVDHIIPCIKPSDGFTSWDDFINSRFVLADKLQGICTTCHKLKTKEENRQRREMKRVRKM